MISNTNRRDFVKSTAVASAAAVTTAKLGVGYWVAGGVAPKPTYRSKLDRVRFGCIGVQGKGSSDLADAARLGDVVAICDIDGKNIEKAAGSVPDAEHFADYRVMLDKLGDSIDAVTVSTPDHTHAVASLAAMRMGKHCFCQKPMTHSIEEARMMSDVARENKLMTQMGNQYTADSNLRHSAALIKAGIIGEVKEIHIWTNRPVWPQGAGTEIPAEATPEHVAWDLWLGPAEQRPFSSQIHQFNWRGLWNFGTGALGDMACHTLNMSYMALNLRNPTSVIAETAGHDGIFYPKWSEIKFEFPEFEGRAPIQMKWYDGSKKPMDLMADLPREPSEEDREDWKHYLSAALLIGEKGMFYSPGDYGGIPRTTGVIADGEFTPIRKLDMPNVDFERSPGHFEELVQAITGERKEAPVSNFQDYAGPLTETILLGNLAVSSDGDEIKWDAENMEIKSDMDDEKLEMLKKIVRHDYKNDFQIREMAESK